MKRRRPTEERQADLAALERYFRRMGGRPSPSEPFAILYAEIKGISESSARLDFWEVSQRTEKHAQSYGDLLRETLIGSRA